MTGCRSMRMHGTSMSELRRGVETVHEPFLNLTVTSDAGQDPTNGNPKYGVWPMATKALAPRLPGVSTSVQSEVDFES
jgi:hypothetical protein